MIRLLPFVLLLGACFPMHAQHASAPMDDPDDPYPGQGMKMMRHRKESIWPVVRIEQPAGARVTMAPGVFGDGIDVLAPFQAPFQPSGTKRRGAYPFDVTLDEAAALRYGVPHPVHLKAWLMVPETKAKQGVLRLAPTECEMRALLAGELEELKVLAEELPTADQVCAATAAHGAGVGEHPMCGAHGGQHGGCGGQHGGGGHGCMHGFGMRREVATLVLRVAAH